MGFLKTRNKAEATKPPPQSAPFAFTFGKCVRHTSYAACIAATPAYSLPSSTQPSTAYPHWAHSCTPTPEMQHAAKVHKPNRVHLKRCPPQTLRVVAADAEDEVAELLEEVGDLEEDKVISAGHDLDDHVGAHLHAEDGHGLHEGIEVRQQVLTDLRRRVAERSIVLVPVVLVDFQGAARGVPEELLGVLP